METLEAHLERQLDHSQRFFWNRLRWDLVLEHVPPAAPVQVVDVGAGTGFLGEVLSQARPRADYGFVEPISGLRERLRTRFGAESDFGDRDSFGDPEYVTVLDVLEHQADDGAFMGDLAAKTTAGSTLLITVPALPALWSQWDVALGHHRRYTKETLRQALDGLPLRVVEMSYLFPELLPAGFVRRIRGGQGPHEDGAHFPKLRPRLNEALYAVGKASLRLRHGWPAGTSVFASLERTEEVQS
jgi:hypothetical protein